jgi:hypothetical protein
MAGWARAKVFSYQEISLQLAAVLKLSDGGIIEPLSVDLKPPRQCGVEAEGRLAKLGFAASFAIAKKRHGTSL